MSTSASKKTGRCQLAAFHLDKLLDRGLIDSYARARRSRCRVARAKYYEPSNREIGVTIQSGDMT